MAMTQINDILAQMGGLDAISRELGVSRSEAAAGAAALAPALLGGFKREVQARPNGLDGLDLLLGQLGGGGLLDDVLAPQPTNVGLGNGVLGQIFGSKDVSRTVASDAASRTGLSPELLKRMLPMLAMLIGGYLAKRRAAESGNAPSGGLGGLGDILGGVLGGGARGGQMPRDTGGGLGDILGGVLGGRGEQQRGPAPGLGDILDLNRDGNPLDDILRMAGSAMR
jgi:hypothetical protein